MLSLDYGLLSYKEIINLTSCVLQQIFISFVAYYAKAYSR